MPDILSRAGGLSARHPDDGETLEPGTIYVAPPDCHLLLRGGRACVVRGPTENGHRPAIDPTFRSAALAFGPGAVAAVLTGTGDDGSAGAAAVAARGGRVGVQDPSDALYPPMPENALLAVPAALAAPLAQIPAAIVAALGESRSTDQHGDVEEEFRLEE